MSIRYRQNINKKNMYRSNPNSNTIAALNKPWSAGWRVGRMNSMVQLTKGVRDL